MTSAATNKESHSVTKCTTTNAIITNVIADNDQELGDNDDARRRLAATEAIEQLATGLDLAAHTIEGYSQNVSQGAKNRIF